MKALPIYLTLTEPLLAPALNGDPNSAVSYPFIPGSLIRGAVAHRLVQQGGDLALAERDLLFNDKTRFLNAYPAGKDNLRAMPVPLSWQREKQDDPPQKIFDLSVEANERPEQGRKLDEPFYAPVNGAIALYDPEKYFNVHTHREDRVMGRATEDSGGVFRYEAIAPGQTFVAVILFEDNDANEKLFGEQLVLGGSRSTAYGRVKLTPGEAQTHWREVGPAGALVDIPAKTPFTLTLLSDLVRQDERGQYTTQVTARELANWLGLNVGDISIEQVFKADSMVGGFNRKWGLPLTQTPALRAGSVFVLQANTVVAADVIRRLEAEGIGKRRVEGFGRVAIAPVAAVGQAVLKVYAPPESPEPPPPEPVNLPDANSRALAKTMYSRLLQTRIDDGLAVFVNQKAKLAGHGITPNQLARLRTEVRGHLSGGQEDALEKLSAWLDKLRPTGRKQYEKARIDGEPLLDWLKGRLTKPDTIWQLLEIAPDQVPLAHTNAVSDADISAGFANQTTLHLMDGVLAKLAKEAQDNE